MLAWVPTPVAVRMVMVVAAAVVVHRIRRVVALDTW
jgi:hypothetical protein